MQSKAKVNFQIRPYREEDRAFVHGFGAAVQDAWFDAISEASLHLVAEERETNVVVAHLQVRDRGVPTPSRRPKQCHFTLDVAPAYRRQGVGSILYEYALVFAKSREAGLLYVTFLEYPNAPGATFLKKRGFVPLERFFISSLALETFEQARFGEILPRVEAQGIRLTTFAQEGDTPQNRIRLYELEEQAYATQPFREVEPYLPKPYADWEREFVMQDPETIFLAVAPSKDSFVGLLTRLDWHFTAVHPDWRGRGIAQALKICCLKEAKRRGMRSIHITNHEDNIPILAINRKLGFVPLVTEAAYVLRLKA